ncbi:alpha-N-acetylglucosaminidase-like [Culicoides brevitarsis]|uniref:alpha-N-acetylglucosaminidase-like n=1 Tax=Culicoides brevitarsis TaxID=469753 RepID=UPI00307C1DDC
MVNEEADSEIIYFQNVCTFSYTYAFWKFEDWRQHIDWIAMHGINLVLAPFQEDIWTEIYREVGMLEYQIQDHLTGPAFLAWLRMGNLRKWPFGLDEKFINFSVQLQQEVIREYQRLGINFAIPAFAGHVPRDFQQIFPNTTFQRASGWNDFQDEYCCPLFVDPTDPLFYEIGRKFLLKAKNKYGTSHIYFADPFNEQVPHTNDTEYLANVSKSIYGVMESVDPEAVWLLQGWKFFADGEFWQDEQVKAFLTAVPTGKILVLDLHSDKFPQYERTKSFYGQPFIWNMLHDFGGNIGLRGSAALIADRAREAFNNPKMTMVGLGITPEGINQNHIIYEFALDLAWMGKEAINTVNWFKNYSKRRYKTNEFEEAAKILHDTIYNYNGTKWVDGSSPYLVVDNPSLKHKPWSWFHPENIKTVLEKIISNTNRYPGELFYYDVTDFTRQYLQNLIDLEYLLIIDGYQNGVHEKVKHHTKLFLNMISDMDRILSCNENFLLGTWLEKATSIPGDENEYNARNQITLWGPRGEISNYAMKQWAGLVQDYVYPRWKLFWDELNKAIDEGRTFDETAIRKRIFDEVEEPFSDSTKFYSPASSCNALDTAKYIFEKYENFQYDKGTLDKYLIENVN